LSKEETRRKKEDKAKPSKTKEGNADSNHTENVGKPESGVEEERMRSREERRQKRNAAKKKVTSGEDAKEILVGSSEDARRRQRVFSLYSQMNTPNRSQFKQQVAALNSFSMNPDDVTPDYVDLLPWNATGSLVNIAKMNALTRANLMKPKQ
jgi:hypothetical protein